MCIFTLFLGFAARNDFSGIVVAATLTDAMGEFARATLWTGIQIDEGQAVVGPPFIPPRFRSFSFWHAHR